MPDSSGDRGVDKVSLQRDDVNCEQIQGTKASFVPDSHGDGTGLAKEARNETIFDLLNLKKDSCSVSNQQFGTLAPLQTVLLCGP